jgi:hypothetical protein
VYIWITTVVFSQTLVGRHASEHSTSNEILKDMNENMELQFPEFAASSDKLEIENELAPLTDEEISRLETRLNIELPASYKRFLKCTKGFSAFGGSVQLNEEHPFFHTTGSTTGMLCFAEFFMEGDGDQVLFDVTQKAEDCEYPVYYYDHEANPPNVRKIANNFEQWLNEFPTYDAFNEE